MKPTYKQVTKTRYIEQISQLAEEIFVQHYTKLTPKVARALAEKYQSDILTDDEIHSGTVNYFMIYLGSDPVGYFALDLTPTGAMCLSRLFLLEKARGQGIGRSIVAYAQKLAEGDGRSRRGVLQKQRPAHDPRPPGADRTRGQNRRRTARKCGPAQRSRCPPAQLLHGTHPLVPEFYAIFLVSMKFFSKSPCNFAKSVVG